MPRRAEVGLENQNFASVRVALDFQEIAQSGRGRQFSIDRKSRTDLV